MPQFTHTIHHMKDRLIVYRIRPSFMLIRQLIDEILQLVDGDIDLLSRRRLSGRRWRTHKRTRLKSGHKTQNLTFSSFLPADVVVVPGTKKSTPKKVQKKFCLRTVPNIERNSSKLLKLIVVEVEVQPILKVQQLLLWCACFIPLLHKTTKFRYCCLLQSIRSNGQSKMENGDA